MSKKRTPEVLKSEPAPTFTRAEAQALINTARAAPTQNLDHADATSRLLQRFAAWYQHITKV